MSTTATPASPTPAAPTGPTMKQANIRLLLDKSGHDIAISDVTPAEVTLLVAEHQFNAGKDPILEVKETNPVQRTVTDEIQRLRQKYAANKINALFPGTSPNLPATFDEARKAGIGKSLPTNKLTEVKS